MKLQKNLGQFFLIIIALTAFFAILFYTDNKYQTPPPYGKSGVINLNTKDLERGNPIFLIDGWLLTDNNVKNKPTYIGEFSNLQRGRLSIPPHGQACYQLTLHYDGIPKTVSVDFPQLSSQYTISLDGVQYVNGTGNARITFLLTPSSHILSVKTLSKTGYYSGMYFPPSLSTDKTIQKTGNIQYFAYALAFLLPLTLAAFTVFLWQTGGNLSRWFGLLCICYSVYMFRYFVFLFSMPIAPYWFFVQNLALYCLCFSIIKLTMLASGAEHSYPWIKIVLAALPVTLLLLCVLIPVVPTAVFIHGKLMDIYYIFTFCTSVFFAVQGIKAKSWESRFTLAGCVLFGEGLLTNLFFSNRFEPIRFFWQFEWCGLFLVLLFASMMVLRSNRILQENNTLTNHLEEQVKIRTTEVTQLLKERKAFFSDMAHDLKAPVFATQSFITAIRKRGVGVDKELQGYLDQAEAKQWEMARRLQGLSTINELDKIEKKWERISLCGMLTEIYAIYHGEAEVQSIHFSVEPPEHDTFLMSQPEKLNILFENLIYNALKATPKNGNITITANTKNNKIFLSVTDNGCGIPQDELPHIFQRFYVGRNNKATGTGLGLYIVNTIVTELGGTIHVQSTVNKGTTFIMEFPQAI